MGYRRAGHTVVGVDITAKTYPFEFHQADALTFLSDHGHEFDFIHASPPCQVFTAARHLRKAQGGTTSKLDLVAPTRDLLERLAIPWVIENVPGAPLVDPFTLCGSAFALMVRRHRLFESSLKFGAPPACRHREQGRPVGVYHVMNDHVPSGGTTAKSLFEGQSAMGIDWMQWADLKEAIPPAYTEWIGRQL